MTSTQTLIKVRHTSLCGVEQLGLSSRNLPPATVNRVICSADQSPSAGTRLRWEQALTTSAQTPIKARLTCSALQPLQRQHQLRLQLHLQRLLRHRLRVQHHPLRPLQHRLQQIRCNSPRRATRLGRTQAASSLWSAVRVICRARRQLIMPPLTVRLQSALITSRHSARLGLRQATQRPGVSACLSPTMRLSRATKPSPFD